METLNGQATPEQIQEWKQKHTDVFALKTSNSIAYVKRPGRHELSHATAIGANDPMKFNETILADCWLGGDETVKTDDQKFLAVSAKLDSIIEIAEAEVEKL